MIWIRRLLVQRHRNHPWDRPSTSTTTTNSSTLYSSTSTPAASNSPPPPPPPLTLTSPTHATPKASTRHLTTFNFPLLTRRHFTFLRLRVPSIISRGRCLVSSRRNMQRLGRCTMSSFWRIGDWWKYVGGLRGFLRRLRRGILRSMLGSIGNLGRWFGGALRWGELSVLSSAFSDVSMLLGLVFMHVQVKLYFNVISMLIICLAPWM